MKWLKLAESLLPVVLMFIPGLPAVLVPVIVQGIQEAEQMQGAKGPAKKQYVLDEVHLGIQAINSAKGKTVIDARAVQVADKAIDTAVAILNLVARAHPEAAPAS